MSLDHVCDACTYAGADDGRATTFCKECDEKMCTNCAINHIRQKPCRDHNVVSLRKAIRGIEQSDVAGWCDKHRDFLAFYCEECKKVVCFACVADDHLSHCCVNVSEVFERFRKELDINEVSKMLASTEATKQHLQDVLNQFSSDVAKVKTAISDRINYVKQLVEKQAKSLMEELEIAKRNKLLEFATRKAEIENRLDLLKFLKSYSQKVNTERSNEEVDIQKVIDAWSDINEADHDVSNTVAPLVFKATKIDDLIMSNIIGTIREITKEDPIYVLPNPAATYEKVLGVTKKADLSSAQIPIPPRSTARLQTGRDPPPPPPSTFREQKKTTFANPLPPPTPTKLSGPKPSPSNLTEQRPKPSPVQKQKPLSLTVNSSNIVKLSNFGRGISKLEDIFIVSQAVLTTDPTVIQVHKSKPPFDCIMEIPVPEIKSPFDMAACAKEKCLYITDREVRCIWQFMLLTASVTSWMPEVAEPWTLSTSSEGIVIITRCGHPPLLEIYNSGSQANLIKRFCLPTNIGKPLHAVQTSAGSFYICHECNCSYKNGQKWGIFGMNGNGQVINRFEPESDLQYLEHPHHLTLDSADSLFIAEMNYERIVVLDTNLRWIKAIECPDYIKVCENTDSYRRISYNTENNYLFLGQEDAYEGILCIFILR